MKETINMRRRMGSSTLLRFSLAVVVGMTLQSFLSSTFSLRDYSSIPSESSSFLPPMERDPLKIPMEELPDEHRPLSTCQRHLLSVLQRQDCFRQSQIGVAEDSHCPASKMPFHNYGAYFGQGFGRIMEHTVLGCLFATVVLQRPCTLDLDCRDTYWTWRSFVHHDTLNWDWSILSNEQKEDIASALDTLPSLNSDEWSTHQNESTHVLPMAYWETDNTTISHQLKEWKESNKILLSPSWGDSWFLHVPLAQLVSEATNGQCKFNEFRTVLQNSMYAPTSLSKSLHQERMSRVMLLSSGSIKASISYGAIHLRTIHSDANVRFDYSTPNLVNALSQCIEKASSYQSIKTWWLIADNRTIAEYMNHSLSLLHNVKVVLDTDPQFWEKVGTHSGFAMKQKFFQEKMAPSMMDFMVLHEAEIAIVTHGSFGSTGARGNGKIRVQACAPNKVFSIYTQPASQN